MDETVLFDLSYGMYIIGTVRNTKPVGCIVNTVVQITNEPNTLAVSINKENYTYKSIEQTKRFSISILSTQTPPGIIGTFGFYSSENTDKYTDYSYEIKDNLPVIKEKCCGTIFCELLSVADRGTHMVLFAKIVDALRFEQLEPMTYSYYHNVIKGKTAEKAPTYQKKKEEKIVQKKNISYRCIVCGYVYEGDLMQEPDTYKCPICGVGKDKFVLQESE